MPVELCMCDRVMGFSPGFGLYERAALSGWKDNSVRFDERPQEIESGRGRHGGMELDMVGFREAY